MDNTINIKTVKKADKEYPEKLLHIEDSPETLYYIGTLPDPNKKSVSIVGSRNASSYGLTLAKTLSKILSENDVKVISGLALGIDSEAHIGAIDSNKPTYALMGCGVNICYPTYNANIYNKIIKCGGGIISDYEINTPPLPHNFPFRNRLIAGLSDVVIVVEGKNNSGSLITAEYALKQGKDIFACPGRIGDSLSEGTNNLIKQGAYILTSADDVLSYLGLFIDGILPKKTVDINDLDYYEKIIYDTLNNNTYHIDEISNLSHLSIDKCINILMSLQLKGLITSTISNYYKLI